MNLKLRYLIGLVLVMSGIVIFITQYHADKYISKEDINKDIEYRVIQSANGSNNLDNFKIRNEKGIGNYLFVYYTYTYKNVNSQACIVYRQESKEKYKLDWGNQISFKLKDTITEGDVGVNQASFDKYLVLYGNIKDNDVNKFAIKSGNMEITDQFERNQYFIKDYILENPTQYSISPIQ